MAKIIQKIDEPLVSKEIRCPCCSGLGYEACCAPYHRGSAAPTALALMRSRYSGYALKQVDYIIETSHPTLQKMHRPFSRWKQEIAQFGAQVSFNGLEILQFEEGEAVSFVTFKAILSQEGKDCSFTEKSRFDKMNGRWFYTGAV